MAAESLYKEDAANAYVAEYAVYSQDLARRVYTSRLIGSNPDFVLHGGGNTSVKVRLTNILGEEQEVIFVKGSGHDLATITPEGFSGLDLPSLRKLRRLEILSDHEMENQLKIHRISSDSPDPSVEALLHVFLPHKFVDHTHADSILILTNQANGAECIKEALGADVAVLPYYRSGFPLAKAVIEHFEKNPGINAVVILNHGIFTFAEDARRSYERMIEYIGRAETFIESRLRGKSLTTPRKDMTSLNPLEDDLIRCSQIIRGACARIDHHGKLQRLFAELRGTAELIAASLAEEALEICCCGVLTPDHAIRTKNRMVYIDTIPEKDDDLRQVVRQALETYKKDYQDYFEAHKNSTAIDPSDMDSHPAVFLVAGVGLITLGITRKEARIAADIAQHSIRAKLRAWAIGEYAPISDTHVFEMEYWRLQRKKLDRPLHLALQGQIAVITGAGGAIGYGIADRLLAAGAVVAISDIDPSRLQNVYSLLTEKYDKDLLEPIDCDVTDYASVTSAFGEVGRKFGGLDIVVPNAGIAHVATIEDLDPDKLDHVIDVNLKGTFTVIKAAIPVFKRQGTGGNVVVISTKNVFDPGIAFGAYSASKAGAHQIAKIAALELADIGVRVNMINPDAVFGDENVCSQLWEEVGPERMKSRGLDAEGLKEYYCQRSLLKCRVLPEHVGNAVVFFASDLTPTTGAALPVDAGNPATFSR
ncbi:bifunctional aldolase/short-chain dehydrogenase [Thermodesulfobacteriota bacterium]